MIRIAPATMVVLSAAVAAITAVRPACAADHWTNFTSDFLWKTPANWGNNALPTASETATFDGSPAGSIGTINLEGLTRTLGGIVFSNAFPQSGYTLAGGTLVLSTVQNNAYVSYPNNTLATAVQGSGGSLTLQANAGALDVTGAISSTTLHVTSSPGTSGSVNLSNPANVIASITVDQGTLLNAIAPGSLGNAQVTVADAAISLNSSGASATYGNAITVSGIAPAISAIGLAGSTVTIPSLTVGSSLLDYETTSGGALQSNTTTLAGAVTFTTSQSTGVLRLGTISQSVAGSSISVIGGRMAITGGGSFSGGSNVYSQGLLEVTQSSGLGTGTSSVFQDGLLKLDVAQSTFPKISVFGFGAVAGNLTGAIYSGASKNVTLAENAILSLSAGPVPVRGTDIDHAAYYRGVTSATLSAFVGEAAGSIYKGIAFGPYSAATFSGSISENTGGQGIEAYVAAGTPVTLHGATFNTTNNATGVRFSGSGEVVVDAPLGNGSDLVYSFVGNGDVSTQTTFLADLLVTGALPTGRTINVSNGLFFVGAAAAVSSGATVNLQTGATLLMSDGFTTVKPTSGNYNVQAGAAVYVDSAVDGINGGATFTFSTGSTLIAADNLATISTGNASSIVLPMPAPIAITGQGIRLGSLDRITTGPDNDATLSAGGGVRPATGNISATGIISAATGHQLTIDDSIQAFNMLQLGDAGSFTTIDADLDRELVAQDGTVLLTGSLVSAKNVIVAAGNVTIANDASDVFSASISLAQNSAGTMTLAAGVATLGAVQINAGTLQANANLHYVASSSIAVNAGTLAFNGLLKPTIASSAMSLTIGNGGTVTTGAADPFSDDNATPADTSDDRLMNVTNNGTLSVGIGAKRLGALAGSGTTTLAPTALAPSFSVASIQQSTLAVNGWHVAIRASSPAVNRLNALTGLTGTSQLDLANNNLVLDYSGVSPADTIRQALLTGRSGSSWTGTGIISSYAAGDASHLTAIGYAEATSLSAATAAGLNGGTGPDATTLLLKYTYYGDANLSGRVDRDDYAALDRGMAHHLTGWVNGDFDYDNFVTSADYLLIDRSFALQTGSLDPAFLAERASQFGEPYVAQLLASVPEPSIFGGCMLFFARRRRVTFGRRSG